MNCGTPSAPANDPFGASGGIHVLLAREQQELLQLAAKERRAARIVERERRERVERAIAAGVAAVERLDADDRDDDLRPARRSAPRRARARRRAHPSTRRRPSTRAGDRNGGAYSYHFGGSSSGRSIASTIRGWNRAAANARASVARSKPCSPTISSMNARTSARAAYVRRDDARQRDGAQRSAATSSEARRDAREEAVGDATRDRRMQRRAMVTSRAHIVYASRRAP